MDRTRSLETAIASASPLPGAEDSTSPGLSPLAPGVEVVAGYRLVERLGRGGYGEVWKATGPGEFLVALKFVSLSGQAGPVEQRSLGVIKNIRHPHLLSLFGSWLVGDYLVLAMELADQTLYDRYREAVERGEAGIPVAEAVESLEDAAQGIDYLNEPRHPSPLGDELVGIQHRDIKPQNLLLVGGNVKVADFGLARILHNTHTSHTGSLTPSYAAPEFFRNETSRHSDQYSLAVSYCLLRGGRLPFTGSCEQVMAGHLMRPPDLSMLPPGERPALARALAKEPSGRWPSCRAFAEEVRSCAVGTPRAVATVSTLVATVDPGAFFTPPPPADPDPDPGPGPPPRRARRPWSGVMVKVGAMLVGLGLALAIAFAAHRDRGGATPLVPAPAPRARAGEIRRFAEIDEPVVCLAFAPDGRSAVSGDARGALRVWEVGTGRERARLDGHSGGVGAVAFAPDGRRALAGAGLDPFLGSDVALRLWDLDAGAARGFEGPARRVSAVAISADGRRALAGVDDGALWLWDLDRARPGRVLHAPAPAGSVVCLAFAPDGLGALSGGSDGSVLLWDLGRGAIVHRFGGHRAPALAVSFAADGTRAAAVLGSAPFGDASPCLRLWDVATGSERATDPLPEATACAAFAPDGRRALVGGDDGSLGLWDLAPGREPLRLDGHPDGRVAAVALAPDGRLALSSGGDGTLRLWRLGP